MFLSFPSAYDNYPYGIYFTKAIYFVTLTLKESIFGLLINKLIVKCFLAAYMLIFVKYYHVGLHNPRIPSEIGESKLDKN